MTPRLALSWTTTFLVSALATLAVVTSTPACQATCASAFDCPSGAYCLEGACASDCAVDRDCPVKTCPAGDDTCRDRAGRCDPLGRCLYAEPSRPSRDVGSSPTDRPEGFDDPVGTGEAFVVDTLAVAPESVGFDLDQRCRGVRTDCVDNALAPLGTLGNTQIQQGVTNGDTLLLVELAGLESPFVGEERALTIKFYAGADAGAPGAHFTASGGVLCCEFNVRSAALTGDMVAKSRAPAKMVNGKLTTLAHASLSFPIAIGSPPFDELELDRATISAQVPDDLSRIHAGLIGGAAPALSLGQIDNPFCLTLGDAHCRRELRGQSSLLDLVASYFQPDLDLDVPADGLDRLSAGNTGLIDTCVDGGGRPIAPIDASRPGSCTSNPELADGYSVTLTFTAVPATIIGVGN